MRRIDFEAKCVRTLAVLLRSHIDTLRYRPSAHCHAVPTVPVNDLKEILRSFPADIIHFIEFGSKHSRLPLDRGETRIVKPPLVRFIIFLNRTGPHTTTMSSLLIQN